MRGVFIDGLFKAMENDESLFFLTADMGINLVEKFGEAYPNRFLNVGIAEQNLIGVSAGLCNMGYHPFAYTISNFLVHRCLEQVRNDILVHHYPVVLLGTSVGFDNASLGQSHHMLDDWGVMSSLAGIEIYCPTTLEYAHYLIEDLILQPRAAYVRIPKGSFSVADSASNVCTIPGGDRQFVVASYGGLGIECLKIREFGVDPTVAIFNKLHPISDQDIMGLVDGVSAIVVVEDQFSHCGLYSKLCALVQRLNVSIKIHSVAPPTNYSTVIGTSPQFYYQQYGMDAASVARYLRELL